MKKIFFLQLVFLSVGFLTFISCKKETSCEGCREANKPPTALAGSDKIITLPTDSILLDGSASNDPDGKISEWLWTKISGPASFNIVHSTDSITRVTALKSGTYQFELKVTDNRGLSAKDTVIVTVDATTTTNHPPVANAGPDQTMTLLTNAVYLNGSASTDPDNDITEYLWTKISGPSSFSITNPSAVQTQATNLAVGIYQFELKVTDAGGLFSKDTMQVTLDAQLQSGDCPPSNRPVISGQLTLFGNLSIPRSRIATVTAGNKIFFAGGSNYTTNFSRVDIYDIPSQTWSTAELSLPREAIQAVACGDKVFFAGGMNGSGVGNSRVDIYDLTTQSWSTAELTYPTTNSFLVAAAVGNKVLFANPLNVNPVSGLGATSVWVDIYDVSNQSWSSAALSEPRACFNAVTAGNKVYFSGGITGDQMPTSRAIDIYDNATGTWSTALLAEPKAFQAGIYKDGKIYWAGGFTYEDWTNGGSETCNVEIKDINTQAATISHLYQPTFSLSAYEINQQLFFLPVYDFRWGNTFKFDIYDGAAKSWAIGVVNDMPSYFLGSSFVVGNNSIFIAGGSDYCPNSGSSCQYHSQVWKLEF